MQLTDLSVMQIYGLMVAANLNVVLALLAIRTLWHQLEYKQLPMFFIGMGALLGLPLIMAYSAITGTVLP